MPNPTLLCLASYFKGARFLEAAQAAGAEVILLTREQLADEPWPMHALVERYLMPDTRDAKAVENAVSYLARTQVLDRVVALDEYDTPTVARLREHLRLPGMGETTARFFRDKLAMRDKAQELGIPVPPFVHVLNYDDIRRYTETVPPPWMLKPRAEASAMGIQKIHHAHELGQALEARGDAQSQFLLERFVPGTVYHVDSIVWDREILFAAPNVYGKPPMDVYQGGGVFLSQTLPPSDPVHATLLALNEQVLTGFGLVRGVTHAEFIRHDDGTVVFLEVAARVGGAGIDRLVEAATGVNLWEEWARLEVAHAKGEHYQLPETRQQQAGLLVCLARQPWPDLRSYDAPEVVWRMHKKHHAGLLLAADTAARVQALLDDYTRRFATDFLAIADPLDSARDA